jgi:hypothetical protein
MLCVICDKFESARETVTPGLSRPITETIAMGFDRGENREELRTMGVHTSAGGYWTFAGITPITV